MDILESIKDNPGNFYSYLNRVLTHLNFNPLSKYFYYIRQSKSDGKDKSKEWQTNNPLHESNTIVNNNSAFREKTKGYIFKIIKGIFASGNNKFVFSVADYSRFSRSESASLEIYHFLMSNKDKDYNFFLEVGDKVYNYREEYYDGLLRNFKKTEAYSVELSRMGKTIQKNKLNKKQRAAYSELATRYFKTYLSFSNQAFFQKLQTLNRENFNAYNLNRYREQTSRFRNSFKFNGDLYYFCCKVTNLMIVCPRELATVEGLDHGIIKGFSREDLQAIADSRDSSLEYIVYNYDPMVMGAIAENL